MGNLSTLPIIFIVAIVAATFAALVGAHHLTKDTTFSSNPPKKIASVILPLLLLLLIWPIVSIWQPKIDRDKLVELITKDRTYFVALAADGTAYTTVLKSVAEPVVKEIEDKDLQDIIKLVEDKDTTKPAHSKLVNDLSEKYALGQVLATKDAPVLEPPATGATGAFNSGYW